MSLQQPQLGVGAKKGKAEQYDSDTERAPAPPGVITKGVLNLLSDRYWYRGEWIANWNLRA